MSRGNRPREESGSAVAWQGGVASLLFRRRGMDSGRIATDCRAGESARTRSSSAGFHILRGIIYSPFELRPCPPDPYAGTPVGLRPPERTKMTVNRWRADRPFAPESPAGPLDALPNERCGRRLFQWDRGQTSSCSAPPRRAIPNTRFGRQRPRRDDSACLSGRHGVT